MEDKGHVLLKLLSTYARILEAYRDRIDRLNVFPVPDGDTGTNMFFTIRSAVDVIDAQSGSEQSQSGSAGSAGRFKEISKGALLGARGNSGVIMSQVVAAFCSVFGAHSDQPVTAKDVESALEEANTRSRGAVLRPVEGTILTVISDVAKRAKSLGENLDLGDFVRGLFDEAQASLERTPSLLAPLARANVVDSGGAGFVLFVAGLCRILSNGDFDWGTDRPFLFESRVPGPTRSKEDDFVAPSESHELGPRYEVMFILESHDENVMVNFREVWAGLGDSIVVVGQDGTYNCHIHTDDIGGSIEAGIAGGLLSRIRVTDLFEEIAEERWVVEAHGAGAPDPFSAETDVIPNTAVVVIANGDGIRRIFRSMGVHRIVQGGQSMNPSTEEILLAIEEVPGDNVIVLPNNTNVTPVAQIAAEISKKCVRVIPTRGVVEGLSALVEFDPMVSIDENFEAMSECAKRVTVAEITQAVRDYSDESGLVHAGDFIGLSRQGLVAVSKSLEDTVVDTVGKLLEDDSEIVTIIEGEGSTSAITREITQWLNINFPEIEVELHHGAQPLYPYLIGIE